VAQFDKQTQRRAEFSEILLDEAQPFMTGEPQVWARQIGEIVTFGEVFGQMAKTRLPFAKAKMRTDTLVFHDIPTKHGILHAVQHWGGNAIQPTDFMLTIAQDIPRAAWVKKGTMTDKWVTSVSEDGGKDEFSEFLNGIERGTGLKADTIYYYARWSYQAGSTTMKLPWTIQLIPLGDGRFVFALKRPVRPGLWSAKQLKFEVEEYMMLVDWLKEELEKYGYEGPPASLEVPAVTVSLVAIPELKEQLPEVGTEIPWPGLTKRYVTTQASAGASQPASQGETKFCIHCGVKIPANSKFCMACGQKQ